MLFELRFELLYENWLAFSDLLYENWWRVWFGLRCEIFFFSGGVETHMNIHQVLWIERECICSQQHKEHLMRILWRSLTKYSIWTLFSTWGEKKSCLCKMIKIVMWVSEEGIMHGSQEKCGCRHWNDQCSNFHLINFMKQRIFF